MLNGAFKTTICGNNINLDTDKGIGMAVWAVGLGSSRNYVCENALTGAAKWGIVVGDVSGWPSSDDNVIRANDLRNLQADYGIVCFSQSNHNIFVKNRIGEANIAGMSIEGLGNKAIKNSFYGAYSGWTAELNPDGTPVGNGAVLFGPLARDCMANGIKLSCGAHGFDCCNQVLDLPDSYHRSIVFGMFDDLGNFLPFFDPVTFNPVTGEGLYFDYTVPSAGFLDTNPTTANGYEHWQLPDIVCLDPFSGRLVDCPPTTGAVITLFWGGDYGATMIEVPDPAGSSYTISKKNNKVPGYRKCLFIDDDCRSKRHRCGKRIGD
jgi:hypothetical protein